MAKRAVITGLGVVTPIGIGNSVNWESLVTGSSGIAAFAGLNPKNLPVSMAAQVKDFDPKRLLKDRKTVRLTFHSVHLALVAAEIAMQDSAIASGTVRPDRFGAILGSGGGGFDDGPGIEELNEPILRAWDEGGQRFDSALFGEKGIPVAYPLFLLKALPNNAFYYISLKYNIQGENDNIVSSFSGGAQAIGDAFRSIRRGLADVFIAGGYDSLVTPNTVFSLDSFGLLSKGKTPETSCRPFDASRDGTVAGEGAGFLIIEELEHAKKRGATIYAEVAGYGNASSAYHICRPDPEGGGVERAVKRALEDAQLSTRSIDWICADGFATQESDSAEAGALINVFKEDILTTPVSGLKSFTGNMGSASGAAEAVYSVMAINRGVIPATLFLKQVDSSFSLNLVRDKAVEKEVNTVLSVNQGIGGQAVALVIKKFNNG